jgi:hypothetical protein
LTKEKQDDEPELGIFWVVEIAKGEVRLLAAGCSLNEAETYGDCLTFGPGHYDVWERWRRDRILDPALRAVTQLFEYEAWPRGRIVFNRARDRFILYADRKLITPNTIRHIQARFHLPPDHAAVETDFHYQSSETPKPLAE